MEPNSNSLSQDTIELKEVSTKEPEPQKACSDNLHIFKVIENLKTNTDPEQISNFQMCFERLLKVPEIDVNCTDKKGNTPLHYTVKYKLHTQTKLLLKGGAYLGLKNEDGELPIEGIDYQILFDFFDSQITSKNFSFNNDYEINLDYSFLIKKHKSNESRNTNHFYPIQFISQSAELKNLILHPLIRYIIWVKSEALAFLSIWNGFIFLTSLLAILHITFYRMTPSNDQSNFMIVLTCIATWICIIVNLARLIFIFVDFKYSGMNWRVNAKLQSISAIFYIGIPIILLLILFVDDADWMKTLTAFCIFIIAIDMNKIITTVPKFQKMSIHVLMLSKITYTLFSVLLFYLIILCSFSLSFYILDDKSSDSSNKIEEICKFFIRVIGMMIGELNLEFDSHLTGYYSLMLIFIFMITIVLINLLNGLAVADVGEIRLKAKLIYLTYQVQLIASCDTFFTIFVHTRFILFKFKTCLARWSCLCSPAKFCFTVALYRYIESIQICPNKSLSTIKNMYKPIYPTELENIECNKMNKNICKQLVEIIEQKVVDNNKTNEEEEQKNLILKINEKLDILLSKPNPIDDQPNLT